MSVRAFKGRPNRVAFSGLFLPSVQWEMKIEGVPLHELEYAAGGVGTLMRHVRRKDVSPGRIVELVLKAMQDAKVDCKSHPIALALEQAKGALSERGADQILASLPGDWECFLSGMQDESGFPSAFMKRYVEIERNSREADAALNAGEFARAAVLVYGNPNLCSYWRDEDLESLAQASDLAESLRPRLRAWLQLQLSILAERAVRSVELVEAQKICGSWEGLMAGECVQPGRHWIRMVKDLAGAKSLPDLLRQLQRGIPDVTFLPSEITLKRWSSGSVFPPFDDALKIFVERVAERAHVHQPSLDKDRASVAVLKTHAAANRIYHLSSMAAVLEVNYAEVMRQSYASWSARYLP